jgi:hypothetical protein
VSTQLVRKLIMTGLIGLPLPFFSRGSVAQAFLATLITVYFLNFTSKRAPFKWDGVNSLKIVSEVQIVVIMLTLLVLQTDAKGLDTQSMGRSFYGGLQVAVTMAIIPFVIYVCAKQWSKVNKGSQAETNSQVLGKLKEGSQQDAKLLGAFMRERSQKVLPTESKGGEKGAHTMTNPMLSTVTE